jgi:predicted ATPase
MSTGLYILDEPEAALSPLRQLAFLSRMKELVDDRSQFLIATHSPMIMAYPDADIYVLTDEGIKLTPYKDTEHYRITKEFLDSPERMFRYLF